jgi:hypothetical protein
MDLQTHLDVHGRGGLPSWNRDWERFFRSFAGLPSPKAKQVLHPLQFMRQKYGL